MGVHRNPHSFSDTALSFRNEVLPVTIRRQDTGKSPAESLAVSDLNRSEKLSGFQSEHLFRLEGHDVFHTSIIHIALLLMLLAGCAAPRTTLDSKGAEDRLEPGLRVLYFNGMFDKVGQIPDGDRAFLEKGRPGAPILLIDNRFGENEVFDSGRNRGVGVQMKGYLYLDRKGSYEFQALSNDGVEVFIDGRSILIDPEVHSDRLSDVATVAVQETGWHALMVKYFQRKGSAALTLYWKLPGNDTFEVIPAKAYAHLPDEPATK